MKKQNESSLTNFWFLFALGTAAGVTVSFLFGTKKGRELLKTALENTENIEGKIAELIGDIEKNDASAKNEPVVQALHSGLDLLIDKLKTRNSY